MQKPSTLKTQQRVRKMVRDFNRSALKSVHGMKPKAHKRMSAAGPLGFSEPTYDQLLDAELLFNELFAG